MEFEQTDIPGLIIVKPQVFGDSRGFFMETFRSDQLAQAGITGSFVQDNHSGSQKNILRGLHYQIRQVQGKLVRTIVGEIYDVAVDLRRSSPTFGRWMGMSLSAENKKLLWIPPGFAHGFYVLSDWAEVVYKTTDYYAPECERTILWNDPTLSIQWPLMDGLPPKLSEKDMRGTPFPQADLFD
ncbi:MAG TPA: dTDP-4-dehydrorhamnose 3,5-epimerase [Anaerolineales bacterium]|nr:dTDP-4-dehydrorhamnose 3,5-epimerase [Anaerolineales bacterium]